MLSALEELPHLLLLYHFTYYSLDLKMTLTDSALPRSNFDHETRKENSSVVLQKRISKQHTLPHISEPKCLNYILCTDVNTENKMNFPSTLIFQTITQFILGCSK